MRQLVLALGKTIVYPTKQDSVGMDTFAYMTKDKGYALPSILLLITILSLIAASVISLQYLQKQQALSEVASIKAEYAAESGIARLLSSCNSEDETNRLVAESPSEFGFQDGSRATVRVVPWGMLYCVTSEGVSRKSKVVRTAIVAERPTRDFENALYFGNPSHQIVFAGESSVKGNVVVGQPGVTTGSLLNRRTPISIPIVGTIRKESNPQVPAFSRTRMRDLLGEFQQNRLGRRGRNKMEISSQGPTIVRTGMVPDSVDCLHINGSASIVASIVRRTLPLYIVANGRVKIESQASLGGLVAIIASGSISVASGASAENALFVSDDSIGIQQNVAISGQFIAPKILVSSHDTLRYPSALFSPHYEDPNTRQNITIEDGAVVEGVVSLVPSGPSQFGENLIEIKPDAKVVGAVHSENAITLDGTVIGTVLTKDFYFYESPTTYLGWIRDGKIDRSSLPKGFLIAPGLSQEVKLDVLDWL